MRRQSPRPRSTKKYASAIPRGGTLWITDEDVDPHKLIQIAGPKVVLGTAMMTGVAQTSFPTKGVYKFTTRTFEMPGMGEAETQRSDNHLRLVVNVAYKYATKRQRRATRGGRETGRLSLLIARGPPCPWFWRRG